MHNYDIEQGFIQGLEFLSPPPQKSWNWVWLLLRVAKHKYVSSKCCLEILSQIAIWENVNSKSSWGSAPRPPWHPFCTLLSPCYYPVSPPNPQLKNPVWGHSALWSFYMGLSQNLISSHLNYTVIEFRADLCVEHKTRGTNSSKLNQEREWVLVFAGWLL